MEDALLQRSLLRLALSVLVTAIMSAESVAFLMTLGLPRSVSSGTIFVASAGFNVHGLIYILSKRAFSCGEMLARGILAKDHTGA